MGVVLEVVNPPFHNFFCSFGVIIVNRTESAAHSIAVVRTPARYSHLMEWSGRAPALPASYAGKGRSKTKEHAMSQKLDTSIAVVGIDIGYVERLIGSIRRECTDHLIVFNAEHLRRILAKYSAYYNEVRVHVSIGKDAPCSRPIERFGHIVAYPILGVLRQRVLHSLSLLRRAAAVAALKLASLRVGKR